MFCFFTAYTLLLLIKHSHFLTGYDLAVIDQGIWKYSMLKLPITTAHAYPASLILEDHVELIFPLIAPLFRIIDDVRLLTVLQVFAICSSGIAVYFLARRKLISVFISTAILMIS